MNKKKTMEIIAKNKERLEPFQLKTLYLFGSVVRDEAAPESDIDILVEFKPEARIGLFGMVRLQRLLSEILESPVDLTTPDSLHKAMKESILREAVRAA